mmetsp:Transcript_30873/g.44346  ORF Transcript_30873/g.44346 Transcript_30873/m.44346 type:complete len:81 (-) Transcript_30873:741-983(-)
MSKKEEKELTNEEIAQVVAFKLGKEFVKGQAVSLIADCLGGGGLFLLIEEVREVCVVKWKYVGIFEFSLFILKIYRQQEL